MSDNKDPKEKLIDRIKRENINYEESFNKSLINHYMYISAITYKNGTYEKELSIIAPKYTDDTQLEQAYKLAHELGHHNITNELNSVSLKLFHIDNIFIKNIVERMAWKEAKNICIEEGISINNEFYSVKNKCLKTYTEGLKRRIKYGINFLFHMIKSYYVILIGFYLIYLGVNNNVKDLFGLIKYFNKHFNGVNANYIYWYTEILWIIYLVIYISRIILKKIICPKDKEAHYCGGDTSNVYVVCPKCGKHTEHGNIEAISYMWDKLRANEIMNKEKIIYRRALNYMFELNKRHPGKEEFTLDELSSEINSEIMKKNIYSSVLTVFIDFQSYKKKQFETFNVNDVIEFTNLALENNEIILSLRPIH